ncbi:hypothetical protein QKA_2322 [Clostridioides difficile DA00165]|nr:hypothetical protein QKA_2322 [Clostridioides difficile DA00165]
MGHNRTSLNLNRKRFAVNDLEEAVQYAIHCGATIAEEQFTDDWRVMIDPAGHPFCLCQMKSIMESNCYRPKYCLLITKSTTVYTVVLLLIIHEYTKNINSRALSIMIIF